MALWIEAEGSACWGRPNVKGVFQMSKIRLRGNKWLIGAATLLALLEATGAPLKWV